MPKTAVKTKQFPCVVGTLTAADRAVLAKDEGQGEALMGQGVPFDELEQEMRELKRDFWHQLYKAHNLDPQHCYTIDLKSGKITQMSGEIDPDTI